MRIFKQFLRFVALMTVLLKTFSAHAADTGSLLTAFESIKEKSQETSPELKNVRAYYSQKKAESYTRFSSHLPNANLILKEGKDFFEERNIALRALGVNTQDSSWGINYEWPLFNFAQISQTLKTSNQKNKSEIDLSIKESEYPITFTTLFLNHLLAKYKSAAVFNSLKKAETGKKEAQLGFELGQKTKIDVLRSEANLVSLNSRKTSYVEEEQNTKSKFLEFSGLSESDLNFTSDLDEENILALINSLSHTLPKKDLPNLEASPSYQSLLLEEKINRRNLEELTRNEYPDLRIQGSYQNSSDSLKDSFHRPYRTHSVALVLTIPLFSGGSFTSSHFEKYFAKKQIEYTTNQKKLELENSLNSTLIKIKALETLVNSLTLNVSQFEELYRLTSKSYQLGKSSLFELLEVQDDLLEAKINLAQNKIQFFTLSQNYIWQAGL